MTPSEGEAMLALANRIDGYVGPGSPVPLKQNELHLIISTLRTAAQSSGVLESQVMANFSGISPLEFLRGVANGNIEPTLKDLQSIIGTALKGRDELIEQCARIAEDSGWMGKPYPGPDIARAIRRLVGDVA